MGVTDYVQGFIVRNCFENECLMGDLKAIFQTKSHIPLTVGLTVALLALNVNVSVVPIGLS